MAYEYEHRIQGIIWSNEDYWCIDNDKESNELREVYAKAKAFDKLVEFYPQKDEIPSDEFFDLMGYIIEGREVDGV